MGEVGLAKQLKHQKGRKQDGLVWVILWSILEWFERSSIQLHLHNNYKSNLTHVVTNVAIIL